MCSVDAKTVRLWNALDSADAGADKWQAALSGPIVSDVSHGETIRRCSFAPGALGGKLLTTAERELFIWDVRGLETYTPAVTHLEWVEDLKWTSDGRLFASTGNRALHFWAGDTGKHLQEQQCGACCNVALSPDARSALVNSTSVVDLVYEGGTLTCVQAGQVEGRVIANGNRPPTCKKYARFGPNSDRLYFWISSNCDECDELKLPHHLVEYEKDGRRWVRKRTFPTLAHVPLWHPRDSTRALVQLPDGGCVAIHGETLGGSVQDSGSVPKQTVVPVATTPDGSLVVCCASRTHFVVSAFEDAPDQSKGLVRDQHHAPCLSDRWTVDDDQLIATASLNADGRFVALCSLATVVVYDTKTFEPAGFYVPCDGSACACAFSPVDPMALAVGDTSGAVALHRLIAPGS